MIDYTDMDAVETAFNTLLDETQAAQRQTPLWMRATLDTIYQQGLQRMRAGEPGYEAVQAMMHTCLLMGVMAGREGWPLVGDPLRMLGR